jgi:hypothetical protein
MRIRGCGDCEERVQRSLEGGRNKSADERLWSSGGAFGRVFSAKFLTMKNAVTALALFLAAQTFAQAQTPTPIFPTENAWWHTTLACGKYDMDLYSCHDTVFNGKNYKQLYLSLSSPTHQTTRFTGGYRVAGQKVFFRPYFIQGERLIYDFSMQVGASAQLFRCFIDTSTSSGTLYGSPFYRVEKIDSVLLPDGWRKRWHLAGKNGQEVWIEGIGATSSPLHRFSCFFSQTAEMGCFWHQDKAVYVADTSQTCEVIFPPNCWVTVSVEEPTEAAVTIAPNPFSESLTVSFSKEMPNTTHLRVFDVLGKEMAVRQEKAGNALVLQRGDLPPGIYFLKIEGRPSSPLLRVVAQ